MDEKNNVFDPRVRRGLFILTVVAAAYCLVSTILLLVTRQLFSGTYRIALIVFAVSFVFRIATWAFLYFSLTDNEPKSATLKTCASVARILNDTFNLFTFIVFIVLAILHVTEIFLVFALFVGFEAVALFKQVKLIYSLPEAASGKIARPGRSVVVFTALSFIAVAALAWLIMSSSEVLVADGYIVTFLVSLGVYKIAMIAGLWAYTK